MHEHAKKPSNSRRPRRPRRTVPHQAPRLGGEAHRPGRDIEYAAKVSVRRTANICRSPTAEGVAAGLAATGGRGAPVRVRVGGTHGDHARRPPRSRTVAAARGGAAMIWRPAREALTSSFHPLRSPAAMGRASVRCCSVLSAAASEELGLFLDFSERFDADEVPDPYRRSTGFRAYARSD